MTLKPPAEIPGGGGIGNPLRPQRIEIRLVAAQQFQIFNAGPSRENIERQTQHMVALKIRQMPLEQRHAQVDQLRQSHALAQLLDHADAAATDRLVAIGQFVMNIAAADHGPPLIFEPPLCRQPPLNSALASSQLFLCSVIHSKCLSCLDW
jgi:hypothetical protein